MSQFGGKDLKRHFTVVMGGKEHGLYVSSTPSSAAKKAVTKLCAANKSKKVEFSIREITQGSKKKTYGTYEGHIEKLKEPIELKGRVIKYKPVAKLIGNSGVKKGGMRGGYWIDELPENKYKNIEKRYMHVFDKIFSERTANTRELNSNEYIKGIKTNRRSLLQQKIAKHYDPSYWRYLNKFSDNFKYLIIDIQSEYRNHQDPILNKDHLMKLFDTLLSLSFNELNKQKQEDLKSLIKELGIDEKIFENNANTIKQAILDKINEYDRKV
jgi:hypothetical protein